MERWTAWVIRAHSPTRRARPTTLRIRERLQGATEDAESLREVLASAARGRLDDGQVAIARSVLRAVGRQP